MKVKVVRTFRDKHTNEIHRVGKGKDTIIEVSEDRFEEIESVGHFVEKVDGRTVRTVSNTTSASDTKKASAKATTKATTKAATKTATKVDTKATTKADTKADTDTKKTTTE